MTKISTAFDNLNKFQNQLDKRERLYVIANNRFLQSLSTQQVINNSITTQTDWTPMGIILHDFSYLKKGSNPEDFDYEDAVKDIFEVYINYDIEIFNITEDLLSSIKPIIVIQPGPDGNAPSVTFDRNFIINEQLVYQFLDTDKTHALISKSLSIQTSSTSDDPHFNDNDVVDYVLPALPLPPYSAKLILQIYNTKEFI